MNNQQTCNYKVVWVVGTTFTNKLMINVIGFFCKDGCHLGVINTICDCKMHITSPMF
jgi:hypothetical protein